MKKQTVSNKRIGTTSTQVLAVNPNRVGHHCLIKNETDTIIYVGSPYSNSPIILRPGYCYPIPIGYTGEVSASCKDGLAEITIIETEEVKD